MPRLKPSEGVELYHNSSIPSSPLIKFDPGVHLEEMRDLLTGLLGAMFLLDLPSLSGPELGSSMPLVVTEVPGDYIRIFVDPKMKFYNEKGHKFVKLAAFNYSGLAVVLDTREWAFGPHIELEIELHRQDTLFKQISARQVD